MKIYVVLERYWDCSGLTTETLIDIYKNELDAREEAEYRNKLEGFENKYRSTKFVVNERVVK